MLGVSCRGVSVPRVNDGIRGVRASQNKRAGPPPGLHSDCQDSAFCPFLPGQDAGRGSGGATQGTTWGWNRRARESPGPVSELDRTQLSQDLGGGTLAIDKLPDNGTRVVVSAGGTQRGREVAVGRPQVPLVSLSEPQVYPLGSILEVSVERGLPGEGMEARPSLGQKILASQSFIGCLPPCGLRGAVTCSRIHSITTGFKTLDSSMS